MCIILNLTSLRSPITSSWTEDKVVYIPAVQSTLPFTQVLDSLSLRAKKLFCNHAKYFKMHIVGIQVVNMHVCLKISLHATE